MSAANPYLEEAGNPYLGESGNPYLATSDAASPSLQPAVKPETQWATPEIVAPPPSGPDPDYLEAMRILEVQRSVAVQDGRDDLVFQLDEARKALNSKFGVSQMRGDQSGPIVSLPRIPQQTGTGAQVAAGLGNAAIGLVEGVALDPVNLATVAMNPASAAGRTLIPYFASTMASQAAGTPRRVVEAAKAGDVQGAVETGVSGTLGAALGAKILRDVGMTRAQRAATATADAISAAAPDVADRVPEPIVRGESRPESPIGFVDAVDPAVRFEQIRRAKAAENPYLQATEDAPVVNPEAAQYEQMAADSGLPPTPQPETLSPAGSRPVSAETITGQNERPGSEVPAAAPETPAVEPMPAEREERLTRGRPRKLRPEQTTLVDLIRDSGGINLSLFREANPNWEPPRSLRKYFSATSGIGADQVLKEAQDMGIVDRDLTALDDFGDEITRSWEQYKGLDSQLRQQNAAAEQAGRQAVSFERNVVQGQVPKAKRDSVEQISTSELVPGDQFTHDGHKFRVTDVLTDEDGVVQEATLKDGPKFGEQRIGAAEVATLTIDRGSLKASERATDFAPPEDPFQMDRPESIAEQRDRLQREAASQLKRQQEQALAERAAQRLEGTSGDLGQGALFGGGEDLFAPPSADRAGRSGSAFGEPAFAAPAAPAVGPSTPSVPATGGRPMPVQMQPAGSGPRIGLPEIWSQAETVLRAAGTNAPIRPGRMGRMRAVALGFYRPMAEVIRMRSRANLPTVAHELAHGLADQFFRIPGNAGAKGLNRAVPKAVRVELMQMGKALYGSRRPAAGYLEEGFAELFKHWLVLDNAGQVAPNALRWVQDWLQANRPQAAAELTRLKTQVDRWRQQGFRNRGLSMMQEYPGNLAKTWTTIRQSLNLRALGEEALPLDAIGKHVFERTGRRLSPASDPYQVFKMKRSSAPGVLQNMLERHMQDIWGNPTGGQSLHEALAPVMTGIPGWERGLHALAPRLARRAQERVENFALYLWARRTLERATKQQETGLAPADAAEIVQQYGTPEFQQAAQGYYNWWDGVLDYLAQSSPANAELVQRIRSGSSNYAPLPRVLDPATVGASKAARQGGGLYRMHGNDRPIYDIFQSTLKVAERTIARAHRDLVARTVIEAARQNRGLGFLAEEVPVEQMRKEVSLGKIREQLEGLGITTAGIPDDTLLEYYTPADSPTGTDPIFAYRHGNGVTRWYQLQPEVMEALQGLPNPQVGSNLFLRAMAWTARTVRLGTTGLRVPFQLITNPVRDLPNFLMQVRGTGNPAAAFGNYLASIGDMVRTAASSTGRVTASPYLDLLENLSVPMASSVGADISATRVATKGLWHGTVARRVSSPINTFRDIIGFAESVPRVAQLRQLAAQMGWQPGQRLTPDQAVALSVAAKEVTTDFGGGGSFGRSASLYIPFFNASIQGARAAFRTVRSAVDSEYAGRRGHDQRQALMRIGAGGAALTALAAANWLRNRDEEWYRALPWRERFLYTNVRGDDGQVLRISRTPEWGNLFMTIPEALLDWWYMEDPAAAVAAAEHVATTVTPETMPTALRVALEQAANRDFFFDRPIVPRSEVDMMPGDQRGPNTSRLATYLGDLFPNQVSPRRVDALIRQLGGGTASDLVQALGLGAKRANQTKLEPADMPVFGVLWRRGGDFSEANRHVADFYDLRAYLAARAAGKHETERERVFRSLLEKEYQDLKDARAIARASGDPDARRRANQLMSRRSQVYVDRARALQIWSPTPTIERWRPSGASVSPPVSNPAEAPAAVVAQ